MGARPSSPVSLLVGGEPPTKIDKIDKIEKVGTLILTSLLEDLVFRPRVAQGLVVGSIYRGTMWYIFCEPLPIPFEHFQHNAQCATGFRKHFVSLGHSKATLASNPVSGK